MLYPTMQEVVYKNVYSTEAKNCLLTVYQEIFKDN